MANKKPDEVVMKVQLLYFNYLDAHGKPFRNKLDRIEFNRRFYLRMEKRHKNLKTKTSWNNCVHLAWRYLKKDTYPHYVQQGESAVRELYHRVWKIYHKTAVSEDATKRKKLTAAPPKVATAALCEEIKTRAEEIHKVEKMNREQKPPISDNLPDEYLKMKQEIMEKRSQLCEIIEKNLDLLKFYDEMDNKIEACRPRP